jgi:hypothetical protein
MRQSRLEPSTEEGMPLGISSSQRCNLLRC